jgi:fructose PTS system EIIA component
MQIQEFLTDKTVVVGLPAGSKETVISELVHLFEGNPAVKDLEAVERAVLDREQVMSTGVGKGLALPHAKTSAVSDTVAALAITDGDVDFDSLDSDPVRILFLLVGTPEAKSHHVRILSRVSRLMNKDIVRKQMMAANSAEDLMKILASSEKQLLDG